MEILPSRTDQPRFAIWIFVLAWLISSPALLMGLNGGGASQTAFAICIFWIACGLWFWAQRLRGNSAGGFLVVGFWLLDLIGMALSDFHHYIKDVFFLVSLATVVSLVAVAALSMPRANHGAVAE
jgi:hypothetical protein